ncbi:carbohydrate ABC transporter permease [Canibacter zhoujuaniae]|uniref:carbohydrate ABC transporter permease n=1 Tax=Canibacter zhoujuaniae TaxID=2708343 RepID=UPI001422076A|nr:sugar ABC transporter permease [Canibacter zhoujuaniae]
MKSARTLNAQRRIESTVGYTFLAPSLIALFLFLIAPIFLIIWLSFHEWNLLGPITFVGFDNYEWLFSNSTLWRSLGITILFVALVIPIQTCLGLLVALAMRRNLPGTAWLRVLILMPWVSAPLAVGVIWRWILGYSDGILNQLLGQRIDWLNDPSLALPAVATVAVWQSVGYVALFFYAGLEAIDPQVYDAAMLDGAGPIRTLWSVTLPLLRPTMFFVLATGVISSFQVFDIAYALTPNGGPRGTTDVIAGRIYYEAFEKFSVGHASVMALILMLILVLITVGQQQYFARRTSYAN